MIHHHQRQRRQQQHPQLPRMADATPHRTVYHTITPPSGGFPRSIARHTTKRVSILQLSCQNRTIYTRIIRLRKGLGEILPMPTFSAPTVFSSCGDIDRGKSPLGVVICRTVVYGNHLFGFAIFFPFHKLREGYFFVLYT